MSDSLELLATVKKIADMKDISHIPWEPTVELMKRLANRIIELENPLVEINEKPPH